MESKTSATQHPRTPTTTRTTYLQRFRSSRLNHLFQRILRVFQFLSPVISLGFFASRLAKIESLQRQLSTSNGAVAGILAAAILYSLTTLVLTWCMKGGGPRILRWIIMLADLLFVGAFITVAYLTRPNGGSSGPCPKQSAYTKAVTPKGQNCNLPWATFVSAIFSAILHFLTALFHEVKDRRNKNEKSSTYDNSNGYDGNNSYDNNNNGYSA